MGRRWDRGRMDSMVGEERPGGEGGTEVEVEAVMEGVVVEVVGFEGEAVTVGGGKFCLCYGHFMVPSSCISVSLSCNA